MKRKLLIIPARKGSVRVKNKNFLNFYGKPLVFYSIETALKSKLFHKIHLSTDNIFFGKKIKKKFNIDVDYKRPKYLSNSKVGLMRVFKYIINIYKQKGMEFDETWFLSACSPLIKPKDLIKADKNFTKSFCDMMLSVAKYSQPIDRAFLKKNLKIVPNNPESIKKKTQNFKDYYFHTGSFGAFKTKYFFNKQHSILGEELPIYRSVDIDNKEDLKLTKFLFKAQF